MVLKAEQHSVLFHVKVKIQDKLEYFSDTVTTSIHYIYCVNKCSVI